MAEAIGLKIDISLTESLKKVLKSLNTLNDNLAENTKQLTSNANSLDSVAKSQESVAKTAVVAGQAIATTNGHVKSTTENITKLGEAQQKINKDFGRATGVVGAYRTTIMGVSKAFHIISSAIETVKSGVYFAIDIFEKLSAIFERYPILGKVVTLMLESLALKMAKVISEKTNSRALKFSILLYRLASAFKMVRKALDRYPIIKELFKGFLTALGESIIKLGDTYEAVGLIIPIFKKVKERVVPWLWECQRPRQKMLLEWHSS